MEASRDKLDNKASMHTAFKRSWVLGRGSGLLPGNRTMHQVQRAKRGPNGRSLEVCSWFVATGGLRAVMSREPLMAKLVPGEWWVMASVVY